MVRPRICRRVRGLPNVTYFKPAGKRMTELKEISLSVEEYEVLRLVDLEEINQLDACKKMKISQPTLSRILKSAHKKVSEAIVEGKAIRVQGGNFECS